MELFFFIDMLVEEFIYVWCVWGWYVMDKDKVIYIYLVYLFLIIFYFLVNMGNKVG